MPNQSVCERAPAVASMVVAVCLCVRILVCVSQVHYTELPLYLHHTLTRPPPFPTLSQPTPVSHADRCTTTQDRAVRDSW